MLDCLCSLFGLCLYIPTATTTAQSVSSSFPPLLPLSDHIPQSVREARAPWHLATVSVQLIAQCVLVHRHRRTQMQTETEACRQLEDHGSPFNIFCRQLVLKQRTCFCRVCWNLQSKGPVSLYINSQLRARPASNRHVGSISMSLCIHVSGCLSVPFCPGWFCSFPFV